MKSTFALLLLSSLVFSCSKTSDEIYTYTFQENAQLIIEENYDGSYMKYSSVVDGNNLVFTYEFQAEDEKDIADDEYSEVIRFEIQPDLNEFEYSTTDLEAIKAVYSENCFCFFGDDNKNTSPKGTIKGKKISDTEWDITIDVVFYSDDAKNISNIFRLQE
ncbi:hypothetical protein [Aurantibacter sp.]|uniref:hypothetical protein n=1 Tax=Aurantibacter sp. TaxID=2807103 RepID=UPI0032650EA8